MVATQLSDKYGVDIVDGRRVPQLIVSGNFTLTGMRQGTVQVEAGTLTLDGILQGSLHVHAGAIAFIGGTQQGSVVVESGAIVTVMGAIEGSSTVAKGGLVKVEPRGRLAGSLNNDGVVIVQGVFGGTYAGLGELRLEGDGYVKEPVVRDGNHFYEW